VRHSNNLLRRFCAYSFMPCFFLMSANTVWAQQTAPVVSRTQTGAVTDSIHELQEQVRELRAAIDQIRAESARYHAETIELRREMQAARAQLGSSFGETPPIATGEHSASLFSSLRQDSSRTEDQTQAGSIEKRVARLEEDSQLQAGKIDEQYQTKVESGSKYRVRLSGIALLNLFSDRGTVDNQDVPSIAVTPSTFDSKGSFGGTLRQSEIGLEVFGPRLAGARTTGDIQFDLGGGFPDIPNGVTSGLFRLRTGTARLDWSHTSVIAGQDNIFFSPLSPTSFASLIVPAFAYAGNLWAWVPQVRVEHRFDLSSDSQVTLQGGILDNLTGETPPFQDQRVPQAGERPSQPGYGMRVAWTHSAFGQPMTFGLGGYYGRQDWSLDRHVDGWASMADWEVPLGQWFGLSGEFYIGDAVGGLGGGIGRSVVISGSFADPTTRVRGVDSVGGWSQLKFKPTSRWEFNGAFGLDTVRAEDLRAFVASQPIYYSSPARNRSSFLNFIYRPYSNLLFSAEYRHLRTFQLNGTGPTADQVNLMMGILF
jgi:hypothetical protein